MSRSPITLISRFPQFPKSLTMSSSASASMSLNFINNRHTKPKQQQKLPILLFDVMDTIVRDPFYHDVPSFFRFIYIYMYMCMYVWMDLLLFAHLISYLVLDSVCLTCGVTQLVSCILFNFPIQLEIGHFRFYINTGQV